MVPLAAPATVSFHHSWSPHTPGHELLCLTSHKQARGLVSTTASVSRREWGGPRERAPRAVARDRPPTRLRAQRKCHHDGGRRGPPSRARSRDARRRSQPPDIARKAIDILHNAGLIAKKQSDETVREDHVRAGKEQAETDRFSELVGGAPTQVKAVLYALVLLTEQNDESEFSTSRVYDVYKQVRVELDLDELSERRVQELLKEQNFLNVICSDRTSRGRGGGVYATHRLLEDPDIVKRVLLRDDRLATKL